MIKRLPEEIKRITLADLPQSQPSVQRKIRHHIIGCEYLAGFCADDGSVRDFRKDAVLCIQNLRTGKARLSNLEGAPVERDLYTITDRKGTKRDDIENAFAKTEADAGEITRRLAAGETISPEEKYRYAAFVSNMFIRTKEFHARLAETLRNDFKIKIVSPEHLHIYAIMHMIKLGPIIFNMNWSVIITSGRVPFLTSDNPVSISLNQQYKLTDSNCSILDKRATLSLPLTKNACLIAEWLLPPAPFLHLEEGHPLIGAINSERIASAHSNIFAPEISLLPQASDTAALRLARPRPVSLHPDDVSLLPPEAFRLPGLFDITEQLLKVMREGGFPIEPVICTTKSC
jgi:hypothetical protein